MVLDTILNKNSAHDHSGHRPERGLFIYDSVNDVIQAEQILRKAGFDDIQVVAPPPAYRTGCDLSIEFPLIEQVGIVRVLEQNAMPPRDTLISGESCLKPSAICTAKDFGDYLMIRAANMKIVVEKASSIIVNISGGGCSDVPYLAYMLIGKTLAEAPAPRDIGFTLCAYTLACAFEEARRMLA